MAKYKKFSFIDFGQKDFVRNSNGEALIKKFKNHDDADHFIMDGGLNEYDWSNKGTRIWCWDDEE